MVGDTDTADGADVERVVQRLARPEFTPIVDQLARRFAESAQAVPVRLSLRGLAPDARRALADLLGSDRLPPPDLLLPVRRLEVALGLADPSTLRGVIERLRGALPDRHAERVSSRKARDDLWSWLSADAATVDLGTGSDRLSTWVAGVRATGLRGGLALVRTRMEAALRVLHALPVDGPSLAGFASDHTGDPHALDHGTALATIILDAVACAYDQPRPTDAEAVRTTWESVGVVPDPVSSTVLALGVTGEGSSPLDRWLASAANSAEPVVLTLANLRRWPVRPLPATARLFVVENPSLIAEAASRGWSGPAMVCSSGRPSVAVTTLIRQLTADGATAFQHADFDAAGLSITQWLATRVATIPWRMTTDDYLSGVIGPDRVPSSQVPETPWDPGLQAAMARAGHPVYEEQLRAVLLDAMDSPIP